MNKDRPSADTPRRPEMSGMMGNLENLAGMAEDLNNQAIARLSRPGALEEAVRQRFGANTSVEEVKEAFAALRDLSQPS